MVDPLRRTLSGQGDKSSCPTIQKIIVTRQLEKKNELNVEFPESKGIKNVDVGLERNGNVPLVYAAAIR